MKDFLVTYIKANKQKVVAKVKSLNVEEVQSYFNRTCPDSRIIQIKKVRSR